MLNRMWREAVRERGWSVSKLDMKFQKKKTDVVEERDRIFERIYKRGSTPSDELVTRVDRHRRFRGTARILRSPFKNLLAKNISNDELRDIIFYELKRFGVSLESGTPAYFYLEEIKLHISQHLKVPADRIDDRALVMRLALKTLHGRDVDLDVLALIGALCLATYRMQYMDVSRTYRRLFIDLLDKYCAKPWMAKFAPKFSKMVMKRVILDPPPSVELSLGILSPLSQVVLLLPKDDPRMRYYHMCFDLI